MICEALNNLFKKIKQPKPLITIGNLDFMPAEKQTAAPINIIKGSGAEQRRMARLWNNYGAEINRQAKLVGLPVEIALVVFAVEAGSYAYDQDTGLIIIRFEPHVFKDYTGSELPAMKLQIDRWKVLKEAAEINLRSAIQATSWGLPQLMGFNYEVTPFESPEKMALAFQNSVVEQIAGFFGFIRHNGLEDVIKRKDWRTFARRYNGSGQVDYYSNALLKYWNTIEIMKNNGILFE